MFAAIYIYRISVEEGMLVAALGDDYVEYQRRTYRLIPLVY
jgi:protein-S-isoprenylcysteine O-methyltransferase Ste14